MTCTIVSGLIHAQWYSHCPVTCTLTSPHTFEKYTGGRPLGNLKYFHSCNKSFTVLSPLQLTSFAFIAPKTWVASHSYCRACIHGLF